jgi:ribosomal-protein-alanine N-acetyltransferase
MESKQFPLLKTSRLDLIEIKDRHVGDIFALFSNEGTMQFYGNSPFRHIQEAERLILHFQKRNNEQTGLRWGIALTGHDRIFGTIGFNHITTAGKASIGYELHPDYWRQGFCSEALACVIQYGRSALNLVEFEAEIMPDNTASLGLLCKQGFTDSGKIHFRTFSNEETFPLKTLILR